MLTTYLLQFVIWMNLIDLGIIRLKENKLYKKYKDEFDNYIDFFIEDLKTLFMIQ